MYPPPPPPPPGGYPPPPPGGYYYPPPPPPPVFLGPEPKRGFALPVLVIAAVLSGILLLLALQLTGEIDGGRDEARLAKKLRFLLILCGIFGVVDAIRAIYGRWKSALSVGLLLLILGAVMVAGAFLLDDARGVHLSTGITEMKLLGGGLMVSGILALCAIPQVTAYGAWRRASKGLPPE
jgi:hypothetical protein